MKKLKVNVQQFSPDLATQISAFMLKHLLNKYMQDHRTKATIRKNIVIVSKEKINIRTKKT